MLLVTCGSYSFSQNFNRPVSPDLYPYKFTSYTSLQGYFLTSPFKIGVGTADSLFKSPCPTIIDHDGYIVWYMPNMAHHNNDFKYFENDSLFGFIQTHNGYSSYQLMDLNMNIVDSFANVNNVGPDAHELYILSNGNYIIGGAKDSVMDLSAYILDGMQGDSNTVVQAFIIQEFDPLHNLVFEWNSIDHIHPTEAYEVTYGYNPNGFDCYHGNAIEEDDDGNLLVSFRHLDAVYKIDHNTGNVIWILGGKSSDFTFPNDSGFGGQHDIRRLPNGNISLYDNANTSPPPRKSRGVEYILDTIAWTATRTWQYIHTPFFFARAMGNHQTTVNEDHLINYGLLYRPRPSIVMVDDNNSLMADFYFKDSVMSYRSYVYGSIPFNFQQPNIFCNNMGNGIMLYAPAGYNKYIWSTGDTTSSIFITSPDTFQVWMDHGVGMLGSNPLIITNMLSDCITGIETPPDPTEPATILAWYDLLGREVMYLVPRNIYIALYSNGKKRLQFVYH